LQAFAFISHNNIVDSIKLNGTWSEATKQARVGAYISFTRWLARKTDGLTRVAIPLKEGTAKTFFKIREKVKTEAMTKNQWEYFLKKLGEANPRDCLVAKIILQGGKRINEVLGAKIDQIDWIKGKIRFEQSKTKGYEKNTIIDYPHYIMSELKKYIESQVINKDNFIFVTIKGNRISQTQFNRSFKLAGERAELPFKIHPHVLRASHVTYHKEKGRSDSAIQKTTGHASPSMISDYDKTDLEKNISEDESLV
jgi:integrase/recombinase XerD